MTNQNNSTHTPGPWHMGVGNDKCFHAGNRVAICAYENQDQNYEITIAEIWPTTGDIDIADGHLIKAAPDMLELLKECKQHLHSGYIGLHRKINEAISKAEGRS